LYPSVIILVAEITQFQSMEMEKSRFSLILP
jgi:hypothetical protein